MCLKGRCFWGGGQAESELSRHMYIRQGIKAGTRQPVKSLCTGQQRNNPVGTRNTAEGTAAVNMNDGLECVWLCANKSPRPRTGSSEDTLWRLQQKIAFPRSDPKCFREEIRGFSAQPPTGKTVAGVIFRGRQIWNSHSWDSEVSKSTVTLQHSLLGLSLATWVFVNPQSDEKSSGQVGPHGTNICQSSSLWELLTKVEAMDFSTRLPHNTLLLPPSHTSPQTMEQQRSREKHVVMVCVCVCLCLVVSVCQCVCVCVSVLQAA